MKVSAIVLASGFSSRMGEDKLQLKLKDKCIFEYTVDLINNVDFEEKIVVTNNINILEYSDELNMQTVKNKNAIVGKSESVKCGVICSPDDVDGYMFFTADQPLVSKETVEKLLKTFKNNKDKIIFPMYGKDRGAPMIFPKFYKEELLKLTGNQGGVVLIEDGNFEMVDIDNVEEKLDIDTREDYERLLDYVK